MIRLAVLRPAAVPLLALLLTACGGGPRPVADLSPPPPARPVWQKPSPPARAVAPIPAAPSAPLVVARIGAYMDALEIDLRRHVRGDGVVVSRQGDAITVVIRNDVLFLADGGVAGDDVLEPLGAILRNYAHAAVAVNGYTDTWGSAQQNLAVSQKRAQAIAAALAHEGVPQSRLAAQGLGESHLRIMTGDDRKEPRNRRIEIVLRARPG
ncbi:MAG TPA: OmpA family protein [Rhizomicrobium sp.]|jgi:outer membrane protein OmpA-like peptidoglycan-associated protein|nr:OmpA family protein [Rhizomicrobium sp.]